MYTSLLKILPYVILRAFTAVFSEEEQMWH